MLFTAWFELKPRSFIFCVKLSACHELFRVNPTYTVPLRLLPPSFGIMFNRRPPAWTSAGLPEVLIAISWLSAWLL